MCGLFQLAGIETKEEQPLQQRIIPIAHPTA